MYRILERDQKSYIISDQATVDRAKQLWQPNLELEKQQRDLQKQQEDLARQAEDAVRKIEDMKIKVPDLSAEMQKVQEAMKKLNSEGGTMNEIGDLQRQMGEILREIGEAQRNAGRTAGIIGHEQVSGAERWVRLGGGRARSAGSKPSKRAKPHGKCSNCSTTRSQKGWRSQSSAGRY